MEKAEQKRAIRTSAREIGSRALRSIKTFLCGEPIDYDRLFPTQLAEDIRNGAPVPVLYSGPIYAQTPEEAAATLAELDAEYAKITESDAAKSVKEHIEDLEEKYWR